MDTRSETEIDFFKYSLFALQAARIIILVYFIVQTRKYILQRDRAEVDSFSALAFLFLAMMLLFQVIARILLTTGTYKSDRFFAYVMVFSRMGVYVCTNIALTFNIGRWLLVLKTSSSQDALAHKIYRRRAYICIIIIASASLVCNVIFSILELTHIVQGPNLNRWF